MLKKNNPEMGNVVVWMASCSRLDLVREQFWGARTDFYVMSN